MAPLQHFIFQVNHLFQTVLNCIVLCLPPHFLSALCCPENLQKVKHPHRALYYCCSHLNSAACHKKADDYKLFFPVMFIFSLCQRCLLPNHIKCVMYELHSSRWQITTLYLLRVKLWEVFGFEVWTMHQCVGVLSQKVLPWVPHLGCSCSCLDACKGLLALLDTLSNKKLYEV